VAELDEDHIRRLEDILAVYEKPLSKLQNAVDLGFDNGPITSLPLPLRTAIMLGHSWMLRLRAEVSPK
jgi:hypothetical protein